MAVEAERASASPLQSLIDRAPISGIQVRVVLLCALVFVVEGVDLNLVPVLAPSIARAWSLEPAVFGIIFSSGPVGLIIGGFGIGYIADRIGRRWALIATMALMTVATVATAYTTNVTELLICRVLTGIGFGGVIPASTSLVSEFLPTRTRTSVVAFIILGQSFGGILTALLMQTPLGAGSWQTVILNVSALCAITTVVLVMFLPESPRYLLLRKPDGYALKHTLRRLRVTSIPAQPPMLAESQGGFGQIAELFRDGRALGTCLLWATFIGVCFTVSFFTNWLPLIYTESGQPSAVGVAASSAYYFGGVIGGLVLPLFCTRWNVNVVLMIVILAGAGSTVALGSVLGPGAPLSHVFPFICGVFVPGAFYMLYPPAVGFYSTAIRSTGVGAAVAFGRIGNLASPAVAGFMLEAHYGAASVFWAMAAPMLASFVALAMFHRLTGGSDCADAAR